MVPTPHHATEGEESDDGGSRSRRESDPELWHYYEASIGDNEEQGADKPWCTARSILGVFAILLCMVLLGLGIKMSITYDDAPLIHVSVAFVVFTSVTSMSWNLFEFVARCMRRRRRGIYPGAHVGVNICFCLASVATLGYVCFWVSQGDHWKYIQVKGYPLAYSPLYHIGLVTVVLTAILLLVHFILSILACREIRRKDENSNYRTVVTIRYDGVGPLGTARPRTDQVPEAITLPAYCLDRGPSGERGRRGPARLPAAKSERGNVERTDSATPSSSTRVDAAGVSEKPPRVPSPVA